MGKLVSPLSITFHYYSSIHKLHVMTTTLLEEKECANKCGGLEKSLCNFAPHFYRTNTFPFASPIFILFNFCHYLFEDLGKSVYCIVNCKSFTIPHSLHIIFIQHIIIQLYPHNYTKIILFTITQFPRITRIKLLRIR